MRQRYLWLLPALALAACGTSGHTTSTTKTAKTKTSTQNSAKTQAKLAGLEQCGSALTDYLTMAGDMQGINPTAASQDKFNKLVADVSTEKTDLTVLRARADATQQAQMDQYEGVLTQLSTGAQAAASGDYTQAISAWTGVTPQIGHIPDLVNQICKT